MILNTNKMYIIVVAIITLSLSITTYSRNRVWRSDETLWEDVLQKSPNKARPHNNLGLAYGNRGWINQAIEQYQIALALKPDYADAHNNFGIAYGNRGWIDKAIEKFRAATRLNPTDPVFLNNLNKAVEIRSSDEKLSPR